MKSFHFFTIIKPPGGASRVSPSPNLVAYLFIHIKTLKSYLNYDPLDCVLQNVIKVSCQKLMCTREIFEKYSSTAKSVGPGVRHVNFEESKTVSAGGWTPQSLHMAKSAREQCTACFVLHARHAMLFC